MNYKVIAGWKVDKIADLLTNNYDKKIREIKVIMREQLEKELIKHLPQDIIDFWVKYPDRLRMQESVTLRTDRGWINIYPEIPTLGIDVEKEILTEMSPIKKALLIWNQEIEDLESEKRKDKNQIRCLVSKLKTYKKLQDIFPEAYEVLILKVDMNMKLHDSTCDSVEELRAKLNSSKNENDDEGGQ